METSSSLKIAAPAKINLTLHVRGKRPDGYHELETRMQKIDLCDWITLRLVNNKGVVLQSKSDEIPKDTSNLAAKAAAFFLEAIGEQHRGVEITLEKNIPVAAGLGGGSSDAASVLKGLNKLLGYPVTQEKLQNIGLSLGADVPFFTTEYHAVLATGVGEIMQPVEPLMDVPMLLVNPGISVSTRQVFENYVLTEQQEKSRLHPFSGQGSGSFDLSALHNDLERVTEKQYPVVRQVKEALLEYGAQHVLMSGSGPTVFAIFPEGEKKSCIAIDDALKKMRLRFGSKTYKVKTSAGAWPSG